MNEIIEYKTARLCVAFEGRWTARVESVEGSLLLFNLHRNVRHENFSEFNNSVDQRGLSPNIL